MSLSRAIPPLLWTCSLLCAAQAGSGAFTLSSPAFAGGAYPVEFTCDGQSASPPLAWSNPPAGTRSFAVTMHHYPPGSAQGPPENSPGKHVYLVIYNIPAGVTGLARNSHDLGAWGINTVNRRPEYTPPCSQGPGPKTYTLTAYALSAGPDLVIPGNGVTPGAGVTMDMLLAAIKGKVLATAALDVVYSRQGSSRTAPSARLPRELEQTLPALHLSSDQEQKVQAIIQQYAAGQKRLRDDLLSQLKDALDAGQYAKIEAAMRQPPDAPPSRPDRQ